MAGGESGLGAGLAIIGLLPIALLVLLGAVRGRLDAELFGQLLCVGVGVTLTGAFIGAVVGYLLAKILRGR